MGKPLTEHSQRAADLGTRCKLKLNTTAFMLCAIFSKVVLYTAQWRLKKISQSPHWISHFNLYSFRFYFYFCPAMSLHTQIICLQEVQENHFHEQMYPALIEMGENIFSPPSSLHL